MCLHTSMPLSHSFSLPPSLYVYMYMIPAQHNKVNSVHTWFLFLLSLMVGNLAVIYNIFTYFLRPWNSSEYWQETDLLTWEGICAQFFWGWVLEYPVKRLFSNALSLVPFSPFSLGCLHYSSVIKLICCCLYFIVYSLCLCMYMHICTHICTHTYTHTWMHACKG
jgi:hypothetical protein